MRYAVLVTGPAGSGKSTCCSALLQHAAAAGRSMHLFNLDPAAERFQLPDQTVVTPSIDIRDLISLDEVMEDLQLGPNGGLVYCFEYLLQNIDWLQEALGDFEDDYLLIDCPGQIELYTHIPIMPRLIAALQQANIRPCALYLLESQFMEDKSKFFAGVLSAMSCMINLEVPHVNILSKMDLVKSGRGGSAKMRKDVDRFLETDPLLLREEGLSRTNPRFQALNEAIVQLVSQTSGLLSGVSGLLSGVFPIFKVCLDYPQIEDFNMVQFLPLDITDEDSVELILSHIDNAIQYGEAEEPKEPKDMDVGDFEDDV
ncbi:hypothetical protein EMMF5_003901 [Cystobasidiomycetes sp. EMM_F5]